MNRSTVSNMLRLLELPEPIKNALQSGKITAGHARSLLALEDVADQLALCGRIQAEALSVRQTETAVKQRRQELAPAPVDDANVAAEPIHSDPPEAVPTATDEAAPETIPIDSVAAAAETARTNHVSSLEDQLGALLGVKVQISLKSKESGNIIIPFASNSEFERILSRLRRAAA
jgi:ParB family chromosome partitioning protein